MYTFEICSYSVETMPIDTFFRDFTLTSAVHVHCITLWAEGVGGTVAAADVWKKLGIAACKHNGLPAARR